MEKKREKVKRKVWEKPLIKKYSLLHTKGGDGLETEVFTYGVS